MLRPFLVTVVTLAALSGCGGDSPVVPVTPVQAQNNVVFTRSNQSRITFSPNAKLYVWCGAWEPGSINAPSVHVAFGGPGATDAFWQLSAVVADVKIGQPIQFPNTFVFDQPKNADVFLLDGTNEVSTQISASNGSMTFQQLNCANNGSGVVQFVINAVIGSEINGGPSVTATGSFVGPVGAPPQ